jgi:DNA-directed RNA polymerase subunit beta
VTWKRGEGGWQIPFNAEQWRGVEAELRHRRCQDGRSDLPRRQKISPRAANKAEKDGLRRTADPDRGNLRPLFGAMT